MNTIIIQSFGPEIIRTPQELKQLSIKRLIVDELTSMDDSVILSQITASDLYYLIFDTYSAYRGIELLKYKYPDVNTEKLYGLITYFQTIKNQLIP